jgi:hypothetical protein
MRRSAMSRIIWMATLAALAASVTGRADTYWIAWEGDDWPENQGWIRCYERPGATRMLEGGVLTYSSTDPQIYDYYERYQPGALNPPPGALFILEWGLLVDWVTYYADPGVCVQSDDGWAVGLGFDVDMIHSAHEYIDISISPGLWHAYALVSPDMRLYDLYIDGALARHGWFAHRFMQSRVAWGDGTQGEASIHHWRYLRFGTVEATPMGDANCDGTIDFLDINPFVQVLADPGGYQATHPGCPPGNADINGDGSVDFRDINPFVALLTR